MDCLEIHPNNTSKHGYAVHPGTHTNLIPLSRARLMPCRLFAKLLLQVVHQLVDFRGVAGTLPIG